MNQIPIDRAYREACLALGEAVVIQRLLAAELATARGGDEETREPDQAPRQA